MIVYTGPVVGVTGPLMIMRADGTPLDVPPIPIRTGGERYRFIPSRRELVYLFSVNPQQDSDTNFWLLDLATMKSRQLSTHDNRGTRTFDISPDGQQIVFDRLHDNSDIVLIDLPERK
jgi:dipeptidyl aminopeptidase/acylaminoacyl peptidase